MPEKPNQKYFEAIDIERFRDRVRHLTYVLVPERYPGWQLEGVSLSKWDFDRLTVAMDIPGLEHTKEWEIHGICVAVSKQVKDGAIGLRLLKPERHKIKMVTLGC